MRLLFIGGTGNLSRECSLRALADGHELWHLNRGTRPERAVPGAHSITADADDEEAASAALGRRGFDAVVDFIAYRPVQVERDLRLFRGRTGQYVFISSASAYLKPPAGHLITEDTPLENPFWRYSRDKIECERLLAREREETGFPVTVVRPSHTYGETWIPSAWSSSDFTPAARMLAGKETVVHGDGQSLWTLTHARDFAAGLAGLLGNPAAIGQTVQVTGSEVLTWDRIYRCLGEALGVEPRLVHVPSGFIAAVEPELGSHFLGDKTWSAVFDCSALARLVPGFRTTVGFREGIAESVAWFRADPSRQRVNAEVDAAMDRVLGRWGIAMEAAFGPGWRQSMPRA